MHVGDGVRECEAGRTGNDGPPSVGDADDRSDAGERDLRELAAARREVAEIPQHHRLQPDEALRQWLERRSGGEAEELEVRVAWLAEQVDVHRAAGSRGSAAATRSAATCTPTNRIPAST